MDGRIDALLTIEGILGAVVVSRQGQVIASAALGHGDAELVSSVASTIFVDLATPPGEAGASPRSYATFELRQGQIHLSAGRDLAIILLTEPGLDHEVVRELLAALIVNLERSPGSG